MKKLFSMILVLVLMWSNVGLADILLENCRYIFKDGGSKKLDTEDGARNQYYINFKERHVLHTRVESASSFKQKQVMANAMKKAGVPFPKVERSWNISYAIIFADEKQISAKSKVGLPGDDEVLLGTFQELFINLNKKTIERSYTAVTEFGEEVLEIQQRMRKRIDSLREKVDHIKCE